VPAQLLFGTTLRFTTAQFIGYDRRMAKKKASSKSKSSAVPKVDPYIDGLMSKLLERLVSLENKLDRVLSQSAGAPSGNSHVPKAQSQQQAPHVPQQQPVQQQRRDRVMYEAICADCSKVCEVPFKPSEDRAVYCKECFGRRKSGGNIGNGMPKLTSVAMPPRTESKIWPAMTSTNPVAKVSAKAPAKKAKKKKR
jgi:CxxC-x17-CxxC domain-containing protein